MSAGPQPMLPGHRASYVVSRTEDALASSAASSIQYVRVSWSDNTSVDIQPVQSDDFVFPGLRYATNWYYGGNWQTAVYGADGKLADGLGVIDRTSRTISLALVDYQGKTWQQFTVAATQGVGSPQGCAQAWPGLGGFTPPGQC